LQIIGEPQPKQQTIKLAQWLLSYLNEILAPQIARRDEIVLKIDELKT
jgi:hypothetical protein